MLQVVLVLFVPLDVHVAGIPVALFGHALGSPHGPDAEFGVAEPVWALYCFSESQSGLKLPS